MPIVPQRSNWEKKGDGISDVLVCGYEPGWLPAWLVFLLFSIYFLRDPRPIGQNPSSRS